MSMSEQPSLRLRPRQQQGAALLVLVSLVTIVSWWAFRGGCSGRLMEFEDAPRGKVQFLVDINRAEWPEIAELPTIGETLARRIVDSRATQGPFYSHEDLRRVSGIGTRKLETIRPYSSPIPKKRFPAVE